MMSTAEAGLADVICVFHLDRLGRNSRELHNAHNRLKDVDVVIYTHDQGVMGRFEFSLYAEMAQMESERIGERTSRGRRAAAERGQFMGDIPYGYQTADQTDANGNVVLNSRGHRVRRIEIDPVTSKVVLRVNLDFDAGLGPLNIARALTKEGIPTPEGGAVWSPNSIMGTPRSMCGLLRNPLYAGRMIHGKVKTRLDERTGKVKRRKGERADMIEHDAPWLRIVPQEVWDRNQERLAQRPPSKLRDRKRPTYLFSGLVKCGVCGSPYVQVTTKMGCIGRHMKICENSRRVRRRDLERVALEGITQRLTHPQIIEWFIPEYLRERGAASLEVNDRHERAAKRLAEVDRVINNLITQVKTGAKGFAAQLLNETLETLGAEKEALSRRVRTAPEVQEPLSPELLIGRFNELLEGLGEALNGNERDAARARDIVRSLITKITIAPLEGHNDRPDGQHTGGVRVFIEGEVSRLVDRAMLNRKIMHDRGTRVMHDLPVATFQFYVDLDRSLSPAQEGLWRDAAIIGRMLDDADWPVLFQEMIVAMNDRDRPTTTDEREQDETRARIALAQFKRDGWARAIRVGGTYGWVWCDREVSDAEWRDRYERQAEGEDPEEIGGRVGIIRLSAPNADIFTLSRAVPEGARRRRSRPKS